MKARRFWIAFILIGVSLIASVLISMHGNWKDYPEILFKKRFGIAVATSLFLSLLLIVFIHKTGKILDKQVTWKSNLRRRISLQSLFAVLLPAAIDLLVMSMYFELLGTNLQESQFLSMVYPIVLSFIFIVNLIFMVGDLLEPATRVPLNSRLTISYKRTALSFDVEKEILYFTRSGRKVYARTIKGREYPVESALATLKEQYQQLGFLQINRAMIINSRIVKSYTSPQDIKRNTLIVVFKAQYLNAIEDPQSDCFEIIGVHLEEFKAKLEDN